MNRHPIAQIVVVALLGCGSMTALAQSQAQAPEQEAPKPAAPKQTTPKPAAPKQTTPKQTAAKQTAPAKAQSTGPNAGTLGHADAMLDYCTKADPSSVAKLQERIMQYSQGAGDSELTKMRNTDEYRKANGAEHDFLDKVQPRFARSVCARAPAAIK